MIKRPVELVTGWLPFGALAMTLYPFVLYRTAAAQRDEAIRMHEQVHFDEQRRCGLLPWLAAYLLLAPFYVRRPWLHPMERYGYEVQAQIRWAEAQEAQRESAS